MDARLFALVPREDDDTIYAWGIEILDGDEEQAVIYRRDPDTGRSNFGVHRSAESARRCHSRVTPLELVWADCQDSFDDDELTPSGALAFADTIDGSTGTNVEPATNREQ